jgi:hypothetical protein
VLVEELVLNAGVAADLDRNVLDEGVAEGLAVRDLVQAKRAARNREELPAALGAGYAIRWIGVAVLVEFGVDEVRAVSPDIEVIDAHQISWERVACADDAAGHGTAAARQARIGRARVVGVADRGVVDQEERKHRRLRCLERQVGGGGIAGRGQGGGAGKQHGSQFHDTSPKSPAPRVMIYSRLVESRKPQIFAAM